MFNFVAEYWLPPSPRLDLGSQFSIDFIHTISPFILICLFIFIPQYAEIVWQSVCAPTKLVCVLCMCSGAQYTRVVNSGSSQCTSLSARTVNSSILIVHLLFCVIAFVIVVFYCIVSPWSKRRETERETKKSQEILPTLKCIVLAKEDEKSCVQSWSKPAQPNSCTYFIYHNLYWYLHCNCLISSRTILVLSLLCIFWNSSPDFKAETMNTKFVALCIVRCVRKHTHTHTTKNN